MPDLEANNQTYRDWKVVIDHSIKDGVLLQEKIRELGPISTYYEKALAMFDYSDFNTPRRIITPPTFYSLCLYLLTIVGRLSWTEASFEDSLKYCLDISSSSGPFMMYTEAHIRKLFTKYIPLILKWISRRDRFMERDD